MPYALFSDNVQVSRAFPSKPDVWRHAEESGLVVEVGSGDEDPPRKVLDMACTIRSCEPDAQESDAQQAPVGRPAAITSIWSVNDISRQIEAAAS